MRGQCYCAAQSASPPSAKTGVVIGCSCSSTGYILFIFCSSSLVMVLHLHSSVTACCQVFKLSRLFCFLTFFYSLKFWQKKSRTQKMEFFAVFISLHFVCAGVPPCAGPTRFITAFYQGSFSTSFDWPYLYCF